MNGKETPGTDRLPPPHGDPRRYRRGCHCRPCTDAVARQHKTRLYLQASGAWQDPYTEAEPARVRLLAWRDAGYGWRELSEPTGLSDDALRQIAIGRPTKPAPVRIRRDIAARILDARINATVRTSHAFVDATGARRQLRAMAVAGWHLRLLAASTGVGRGVLCSVRSGALLRVRAQTADAVRREFERVGARSPGEFGVASKDVVATANRAAAAGWVPADRWGEDIDDPAAVPLAVSKTARPLVVAEDVEFIRRTTDVEDWGVIADRLGITRDTLDRNLDRARALLRDPGAGDAHPETPEPALNESSPP